MMRRHSICGCYPAEGGNSFLAIIFQPMAAWMATMKSWRGMVRPSLSARSALLIGLVASGQLPQAHRLVPVQHTMSAAPGPACLEPAGLVIHGSVAAAD